jgi:hypothetical protein
MKWIVIMLVFAEIAAYVPCSAATECSQLQVEASVKVDAGNDLTLADLLAPDACAQVNRAAARVSLGRVPQPGSLRVFDGRRIQQLLKEIALAGGLDSVQEQIPERIVVQVSEATKSCAEIARTVLASLSGGRSLGLVRQNFDCAAAGSVASDATLELTRSGWNRAMRRWEFILRCTRASDCVPFLVWARAAQKRGVQSMDSPIARTSDEDRAGERLVKPGQTAILRWDQGGIRIVVPVTCLDGGSSGQTVRVRFKNAPGILRAEILGDGTLRASL